LEKEWSRAALRGAWRGALEDLAICAPVLVHGDACENQFLVDANLAITGVLDWGRAGIGHPLFDFDFGEWDTELFRFEAQFESLRRGMWEGYTEHRDTALPDFASVHMLFSLVEAIFLWDRRASGKPMTPWQKARLGLSLANVSGATRLLRL
jgi:aminoglycoside phosphotransferase (APT) family kinase protein